MSLSPVQQKIVDASGNLIVSASAGTGKTHTMVAKIAKDLEENHSHKVIAAITFTVKAAKEIGKDSEVKKAVVKVGKEYAKMTRAALPVAAGTSAAAFEMGVNSKANALQELKKLGIEEEKVKSI